jgi:hypothetical protein
VRYTKEQRDEWLKKAKESQAAEAALYPRSLYFADVIVALMEDFVILEAFYRTVAQMTFNHDVLEDYAVVYPSKLGEELEKVDPEWYKNA